MSPKECFSGEGSFRRGRQSTTAGAAIRLHGFTHSVERNSGSSAVTLWHTQTMKLWHIKFGYEETGETDHATVQADKVEVMSDGKLKADGVVVSFNGPVISVEPTEEW